MAWSDYGCIIKQNGEYVCEESIRNFIESVVKDDSHGAYGEVDFYVKTYKTKAYLVVNLDEVVSFEDVFKELLSERMLGEEWDANKKITVESHNVVFTFSLFGENHNCMICEYKHPTNGFLYQFLYGYGVSDRVARWWETIGVPDDEIKSGCITRFKGDEKVEIKEYLWKANLPTSIANYKSGNGEGIWVCVDSSTYEKLGNNHNTGTFDALIKNDVISYPKLKYDTVFTFEFRGKYRPVANYDMLQEYK